MLKRNEYTRIFSEVEAKALCVLAQPLKEKYVVRLLRPAQKTLTMIKMREPVQESLFYLGEVLCCECLVDVEGQKGFAVMMGDDFEKAKDAAILDAVFRAGFPEKKELEEKLLELEKENRNKRSALNAQILESRVQFNTM